MTIQRDKKCYRVIIADKQTGRILRDEEQASTYGVFIHVLTPTKLGVPESYIVTVEYVRDHHFKASYAKRLAAQQQNEERRKKRQQEQDEKALVRRRKRIMNQIELAFEKKGKDAVKFVTCDKCDAPAKVLCLTHENPGSTVINPDQITGALCEDHKQWRSFKTTAFVECALLEFFYDGVKQIYVNK